jgi:hypothetical protein
MNMSDLFSMKPNPGIVPAINAGGYPVGDLTPCGIPGDLSSRQKPSFAVTILARSNGRVWQWEGLQWGDGGPLMRQACC